jgi:hypothetical protein
MGGETPGESGRRVMYPGQEVHILRTGLFMLLCQEEPYRRTIKDELRGLWRALPAITDAWAKGKSYETIRDTIRRGWKPARAASR